MNTYFTLTPYSSGRWLAALAGSLVLWGIAYANAPAPAWQLGLPVAEARPAGQVASYAAASRSSFRQALIDDLDNALALRQLQGGAGPLAAGQSKASRASAVSSH